MKTILYSLIAIFIFGIIASGFTNKGNARRGNTQNSILIQSTDKNASSVLLSQSAKIISARLKDFSPERFDVKVIQEKNQIRVELTNARTSKTIEKLLLQKGSFAFYETYNRVSFSKLLNGNTRLFSLLNSPATRDSSLTIGCASGSEIEKVTAYLNTLGLEQKCKFAWDQHSDDSDVCLYALKIDNAKGALIIGNDIESVKSNQDNATKAFMVNIRLKRSAVEIWSDATKRNINKAIAIVLDNEVLSAPKVRSVIRVRL